MMGRNRGCAGKRQHATRDEAFAQLASLRRRDTAIGVHVYRCPHCGGWHVGHRLRQRKANG